MTAFEAGNLDDAGNEMRTLDMYEREVGIFGYWAASRGHEQAVKWVKLESGWRLVPMKVEEGLHVVASTSSIIEYALKMATGDPSVPKGGDPKYRNGEWYKTCFGQTQGDFMTEENAKEYGHGAHANEPYRFVTIERKLTALRKWYDEVLKDTTIANPARNNRLSKVMTTLEKMMGRGRKHTTPMLREQILKAVNEEIDLEDVDEVRNAVPFE